MRLVLAKLLISTYLCFHAYQIIFAQYNAEAYRKVVEMNVEELDLHPSNKQFLNLYLLRFIAFCFATSIVAVFSKNLLPKMLTIVGIALWVFFTFHPKLPPSVKFMERCEHVAIAGAMLFIGGSEFFEKEIGFEDFKKVEERSSVDDS